MHLVKYPLPCPTTVTTLEELLNGRHKGDTVTITTANEMPLFPTSSARLPLPVDLKL
jgi:hypothetical protein